MYKGTLVVGITAYREGKRLLRAYKSICNQTDSNWKGCIILDGNADEETLSVFHSIQDSRFDKIQLPENTGGPYIPREVFFKKFLPEICLFIDADDCYTPLAFTIIRQLFADPEIMWISGGIKLIFENKNSDVISEHYISGDPITREQLALSSTFPGVVLFRSSLFKMLGGYDRFLIKDHADTDLMFSILESNMKALHTNEILIIKYERPSSMSRSYYDKFHIICEYIAKKHPKTFSNQGLKMTYLSNAYFTASRSNLQCDKLNEARQLAKKAMLMRQPELMIPLAIILYLVPISKSFSLKLLALYDFYKSLQSRFGVRTYIKNSLNKFFMTIKNL